MTVFSLHSARQRFVEQNIIVTRVLSQDRVQHIVVEPHLHEQAVAEEVIDEPRMEQVCVALLATVQAAR